MKSILRIVAGALGRATDVSIDDWAAPRAAGPIYNGFSARAEVATVKTVDADLCQTIH